MRNYSKGFTTWKVSKYGVYLKYRKLRTKNNSVFEHFSRSVCFIGCSVNSEKLVEIVDFGISEKHDNP